MMLALVAGCRASDEGAQADNSVAPQPVAVAAAAPPAPPPPAPIATPPAKPAPTVIVRAQPAPEFPLDLPPSDVAASAAPFPREVTQFMVSRDGCDHFRGEEAYDAERRAYIDESVAELCQGSDAKLAMLRRRYSGDPSVIAALRGYEDRIEDHADD
ncbi:hypothetical protein [Sphingobium sp.]|uniref:hypothetical protein n=1 Tax=Sphingobium sp. TaxID=1912891 RepID=UPI003BB54DA1